MKMAVLNTDLTYTACPTIRYRELDLGCSFYKSSVLQVSFCSELDAEVLDPKTMLVARKYIPCAWKPKAPATSA